MRFPLPLLAILVVAIPTAALADDNEKTAAVQICRDENGNIVSVIVTGNSVDAKRAADAAGRLIMIDSAAKDEDSRTFQKGGMQSVDKAPLYPFVVNGAAGWGGGNVYGGYVGQQATGPIVDYRSAFTAYTLDRVQVAQGQLQASTLSDALVRTDQAKIEAEAAKAEVGTANERLGALEDRTGALESDVVDTLDAMESQP